MQYDFEWDAEKASSNRDKHDVGFEEAATAFGDPRALSIYDEEHSTTEDRWITLGISAAGRLLVVCHTFEERAASHGSIRIFSSRKATKSETDRYKE